MVNVPEILQRIKKSVLTTDPTATVILYGSYARGDYRDSPDPDVDSDIDILVLLDKEKITYEDRTRISDPLFDIGLDVEKLISKAIFTKNSWETSFSSTPFYRNVTIEGKIL